MIPSAPSPLPTQQRSTRLLTILGLLLIVQLFILLMILLRGPGRLYLAGAVALLALAVFLAVRASMQRLIAGAAPDQLLVAPPRRVSIGLRGLNLVLLGLTVMLQVIWLSYTFRPCSGLDLARRLEGCVAGFRHIDTVTTLDIAPDGTFLAARSLVGNVSLWRLDQRTLVRRHPAGIAVGSTLAFSPDGRTLAVGRADGTVQLSDVASGAQTATIGSAAEPINSVAFSPDGALLATGAWDQTVRIWQVRDGRLLHSFTGLRESVHNVTFSPDGALLAAGDNRAVWLWNVASGQLHVRLETESLTQDVAFSPDGALLAAGGWRGGVELWRVSDGTLARRLDGRAGQITGLAFSPDGAQIAAASQSQVASGQVEIWSVADGVSQRLIEPRAAVGTIGWLRDGTQIAIASERQVELWRVR